MTIATNSKSARLRFTQVRGYLAALAVVGIAATAIIGPLAAPGPALADQDFYDRINQQFVPSDVEPLDIHLEASSAEELPPEPAPTPEPAVATTASVASVPMYTGGGSPAEWMAAAGIPESDWGYVDAIVSRESGWNPNATNSSSGACGLVQALPCSKVPGGNGYDPVANLTWAIGYAHGRYGGWAGAYDFWQANHWW